VENTENVVEILGNGPDGPQRQVPHWVKGAAAVLVVVGVVAYQVRDGDGGGEPRPVASSATSSTPSPLQPPVPVGPDATVGKGEIPGLLIDGPVGGLVNRVDRTAARGPWSVTVRRADGSLGRHSAVVTFPVPKPVDQGGPFLWPLGGDFARIRGDLSFAELRAIADATVARDGRPVVRPPKGFKVASSAPYWSSEVHETRYGTRDLGESDALDAGLTFTGVRRGGWFEDQLFMAGSEYVGSIHAKPVVAFSVPIGGNGGIAWEPSAGVIAYIGYSGGHFDRESIEALLRLGARSVLASEKDWQDLGPQKINQPHT
jgi:hypothetical protein